MCAHPIDEEVEPGKGEGIRGRDTANRGRLLPQRLPAPLLCGITVLRLYVGTLPLARAWGSEVWPKDPGGPGLRSTVTFCPPPKKLEPREDTEDPMPHSAWSGGGLKSVFFLPHFWWLLWRPRVPGHTHEPLIPVGRLCLLADEVLGNRMVRLMESYCLNCGWIGAPVM